jgi:uncharacterized protein (DUF2147 family)
MNGLQATIVAALLLCGAGGVTAGNTSPCDSSRIVGRWLSPDSGLIIEFEKKKETYSATIVGLAESFWDHPKRAKAKESGADTDSLASEIIGTMLFSGLRCDNGRWVDGTLYVPGKDRRFDCTVRISDDGEELDVTVKAGFRRKTKTWTRVDQ